MSGMTKVIEHVVLFRVKDNAAHEAVEAWLSRLNELSSLDSVLCLRAAPSRNVENSRFTHILHARYADMEALSRYTVHPLHVEVVEKYGKPILEDLLALDWETSLEDPSVESFKAFHFSLMKPLDPAATDVSPLLLGISDRLSFIRQVSFGNNLSPGRSKGFSWGFLVLFSAPAELDQFVDKNEHFKLFSDALLPKMEEIVHVEAVC
eukprot:TRINITY_DN4125_c0_g1_i1.p1 TRINITY_DN4125_c0_g1~~TRINITY_DN4125_c0_g1_i1.p1  ORF type:complete len:218 (-),score=7.31 TRINITY_DN4125_c0_g1_i1:229-849(-)